MQEKEEENLDEKLDLKLLDEDPDYGKPEHHPLMDEKLRMKKIEKNKIEFPSLSKDLDQQAEFIETALEEVPFRAHKISGGDDVVRSGLDYEGLAKVSLRNLPPESVYVSKGAWNFWKSVLMQESRENSVGTRRLSILSQNFPVEFKDFSYKPSNLIKLCSSTLFSMFKQGLLEISDSALASSKESVLAKEARKSNEKALEEFLKWRSLDYDKVEDPLINSFDSITHQLVIYEFCTDSVDLFLGNRQWNKIIEKQNYRIYGLPSGRPFKPFKFTFGRDVFEMRTNCASCIWDLYVNKVSKDLFIDGYTKSGKYDASLVKKSIESFCHFASVAFFQGELSLDDQKVDEKSRQASETSGNLDPNTYDFEKQKRDQDESYNYEQVIPENLRFLESPLDDEIQKISFKTTPTGYHDFKANQSLNQQYLDQERNSRLLFGSERSVDEILDQGVSVGLTVGETNQETLRYESLYRISPKESLVAFQQWRAILYQMVEDSRTNRVPSITDLPTEQPREWNTPQYSSEKFFFVCVELLGSLLSQSKIKVRLPHGGELHDYQVKVRETIKVFCREATNRYFRDYDRLFDVISATYKGNPMMDDRKISSKWSIIQEQVIVDFISGTPNRVSEVTPILPKDFNPDVNKFDFEDHCINAIYGGYYTTPPTVTILSNFDKSQEGESAENNTEIQNLIMEFCKRASDRYYTMVEYIFMVNESKNWIDPKAKSAYSVSSLTQDDPDSSRTGSLQGIPWPPIKSPSIFVFRGKGRPDLFRNSCFSYLWRVWESGRVTDLYIDGRSFEKSLSLDMAKLVLEDFCTTASMKLYKVTSRMLPPRDVVDMDLNVLIRGDSPLEKKIAVEMLGEEVSPNFQGEDEKEKGKKSSTGKGKRRSRRRANNRMMKNKRTDREKYKGIRLDDIEDDSSTRESDSEFETEASEEDQEGEVEFKDPEKNKAKSQWDQLKQQLVRDINMNRIRFLRLPDYAQTLYSLWPESVSELAFTRHCIKVLDELIKLRLAILSSYYLDDREYVIERFCEESKFYVFSNLKEKTREELGDEELGFGDEYKGGIGSKVQEQLLDTLIELSNEGYPLYRWLENIMSLKAGEDRETLSKAVQWGQKKGDWHYLALILRELDKEMFMSIQRNLQGISPQGFLMTSGIFDKDATVSIEATWGAIYLQSLKDAKSGNPRVLGLVGSPPPREIWSGANNEQEFVLACGDALKKLKVNPPYIVFNTNGQGEIAYIQSFCEDALDTLVEIQREPEKILSLDFAYSGCINEAMRNWQWNQIYAQMDIDLKELGQYRISGIPPSVGYKIFKGGKTLDEVEDQCGDALEELNKKQKIKIHSNNASQFCRDAAENICKTEDSGKSNCNIERIKLEEVISLYHMDTPIGNPLKLDSRTRCMRIWTLIRNSIPGAIKKNIISTALLNDGDSKGDIGFADLEADLGLGPELRNDLGLGLGFGPVSGSEVGAESLPLSGSRVFGRAGAGFATGAGSLASVLPGNIRFIALKEIMDVCSPIDTPNNIVGVFLHALRKIQKINSLRFSEEGVYAWVKELVVRYFADERTENEFLELTGVNVFGDPYSKDDGAGDLLSKGLHSKGIPLKLRELTDNEKAVMREKENQRISSIVDGIVKQVLPSISHLTTKEKKKEITDKALKALERETERRDMLLNNQIGNSQIIQQFRSRPDLPEEEQNTLTLGKVPIPILKSEQLEYDSLASDKKSEKILARVDTRWEKVVGGKLRFEKVSKQQQRPLEVNKNMERSFRKLNYEWNSISNFGSHVITNIPKDRPSEYGDKGYRDMFSKEAMIRRCTNFFSNESLAKNYNIIIKGNYIERISHIRTHCSRSAARMYDLISKSPLGASPRRAGGKAVHRSGRLIYVEGEKEPLQQVVLKQRIASGNIVENSEVSPEELEQSEPAGASGDFPGLPIGSGSPQVEYVGSNDGYKALGSEYVSGKKRTRNKKTKRQ
ncbi:putative Secreted Protein [Cryptosporidium felis]|nr:putative Secreted Protein [Cryptosporidium felis]